MNRFLKVLGGLVLSLVTAGSLHGAWNPVVDVSDVGGSWDQDGPVLDVNASNNGVAVWTNPLIEEFVIQASSYTFGSGWGPPIQISSPAINPFGGPIFTGQADPSVSMNQSGYVVAAWEGAEFIVDEETDLEEIISATRSPQGIWTAVQRVSRFDLDDRQLNPENPFVAVSDSGLAVVVWTELRTTGRFIVVNRLPFGGSWDTPIDIDNPAGGFREDTPRIAINSSNSAVAVWKATDEQGNKFVGASTTPDAGAVVPVWTTVELDPGTTDVSLPQTGIDENGNAVAVWVRQTGFFPNPRFFEVVASYFSATTGTWSPYVVLDTASSTIGGDLELSAQVVMDQFGNATAVWDKRPATGEEYQVYSSRLPLGGTWSAAELISPLGIDHFFQVGFGAGLTQVPISVDLDGNVIIIMEQGDGTLQSLARFVNLGWQTPEDIALPDQALETSIGYGSCGFAIALWEEAESETAQASDNFGIFPGPTGFTGSCCCQKFASQKRCLSLLEWDAGPCFFLFNIYRNGVLIATVPGNQTSFVDPAGCDRNSVTYTLRGVNLFGGISAPVTITIP